MALFPHRWRLWKNQRDALRWNPVMSVDPWYDMHMCCRLRGNCWMARHRPSHYQMTLPGTEARESLRSGHNTSNKYSVPVSAYYTLKGRSANYSWGSISLEYMYSVKKKFGKHKRGLLIWLVNLYFPSIFHSHDHLVKQSSLGKLSSQKQFCFLSTCFPSTQFASWLRPISY